MKYMIGKDVKDYVYSLRDYKRAVFISDVGMENLLKFSRNWLNHVNPYTGVAWKEEPALAFISLVNEDPLTGWSNMPPEIQALYNQKLEEFLAAHDAASATGERARGAHERVHGRHPSERFPEDRIVPARPRCALSDQRSELQQCAAAPEQPGALRLCGQPFLRLASVVAAGGVAAAERRDRPEQSRHSRRSGFHAGTREPRLRQAPIPSRSSRSANRTRSGRRTGRSSARTRHCRDGMDSSASSGRGRTRSRSWRARAVISISRAIRSRCCRTRSVCCFSSVETLRLRT